MRIHSTIRILSILSITWLMSPSIGHATGPGPDTAGATRTYEVDLSHWFQLKYFGTLAFTASTDEFSFFDAGDLEVELLSTGDDAGSSSSSGSWFALNWGDLSIWFAVTESTNAAAVPGGTDETQPADSSANTESTGETSESTTPDQTQPTNQNESAPSSENESGHFCFFGIAIGDSLLSRVVTFNDLIVERGRYRMFGRAIAAEQPEPPASDGGQPPADGAGMGEPGQGTGQPQPPENGGNPPSN